MDMGSLFEVFFIFWFPFSQGCFAPFLIKFRLSCFGEDDNGKSLRTTNARTPYDDGGKPIAIGQLSDSGNLTNQSKVTFIEMYDHFGHGNHMGKVYVHDVILWVRVYVAKRDLKSFKY